MTVIAGFVEKIKYRNEENGYTVLSVSGEDGETVLVGTFPLIEEGEYIRAEGMMKNHPVYGEQLVADTYEVKVPEDSASVERYLSSGVIKGVGETLAKRIVKTFKKDTLRILEEEPERLSEIKGISERMAMDISSQIEKKRELRDAMLFLAGFGIRMNLAVKLYQKLGDSIYTIIKTNPYQLADEVTGIGFRIADEIAGKAGFRADSEFRIRCGMLYELRQAVGQGHSYLPKQELIGRTEKLLGIPTEGMELILSDLQMDRRVVVRVTQEEQPAVYLSTFYQMERGIAAMLHDLDLRAEERSDRVTCLLDEMEQEEGLVLDGLQRKAVTEAAGSGVLLITGGPGTGKTTTINAIIRYFEQQEAEILLAAPTGRAAKRMAEATGHEAKTIHRLLEMNGVPQEDAEKNGNDWGGMRFERNEDTPLEADCVIIDEMSMVDLRLMYALLKAVSVGTHLILVGDSNQLPSVGAGNVLRDLLDSDCFNVVRLNHIYRQAAESDIVLNAHRMIGGEQIDLTRRSRDFLFIRQNTPEGILQTIRSLAKDKLPGYVDADMRELQIMTPMRKGPLGVEALNRELQRVFNPAHPKKEEKELNGTLFREGDKVMQVRNDYNKMVYNGDIGVLLTINRFAETLTVQFDEERIVEYAFSDGEELELAYAITIHKSQGSEYPAVILPIWKGPRMLLTRNLIYTAVTRARACVAMVGDPVCFFEMVGNTSELRRYSGLADMLRELCG